MTTLDSVKQTLLKLKPELSQRFYVSDIGVFGSITREDFQTASDIDIIVDFKKPIGIEFIELADFLEANFDRKVDLVSRKGLKPGLFSKIKDEIQYV